MSQSDQPKRVIEYYVNSFLDRAEDETESTSERFTVLMTNKSKQIQLMPGEKDLRLKLFAVEIPNVLPNFKANENRLWFSYDNSGTDTVSSIEIDTEKIYATPSALMAEINSLFPASAVDSATGLTTTDLSGMEISYDDSTKKCTLTNNTVLGVPVRLISSFRYANSETILTFNDANDRFGFSTNYTTAGVMASGGGTLTGNGTIRMNRTNRYHVVLEQQSAYFSQSITASSDKNHQVLASVSVGPYGTLSTFSYVSSISRYLPSSGVLNELTFSILDDEYQPVDFVNHPVTMALQFETV